ncbi:MAG TPA: alkyl sulfatase dimerization domain-containing protein [Thermoanaerobaculia bacterium]|nr:alkyl sulfatase dimerization domain-containing protein [Thermoanaerobaculia bacterium]
MVARRSLVILLLAACALVFAQEAPKLSPLAPPANPLLVAHKNWFVPEHVWDLRTDPSLAKYVPPNLTYRAYSAVGFSLANTIAIVGPTKDIVIIDTLETAEDVKKAIAAFREKKIFPDGPLPIRAIIYTHNHIDHIGGVKGYLEQSRWRACVQADAANTGNDSALDADALDCVSVIGQENIVDGVNNTATVIGTMINARSAYMYGGFIPESWRITNGIGYEIKNGTSDFVMPSRTFANSMKLKAAGVNMELFYVPSETNDELSVFVPDANNGGSGTGGLLQSAEVVQGPSFPNLYSLRGTSYRSPATWYRSVDKLRTYDSWCMLPSHGTPLCGARNIQTLLLHFRDAIQYTHDQSVRLMNQGYTMDQLPQRIPMPEYLIEDLAAVQTAKGNNVTDPRDYLRFFYGSVPQSVRELYFGYLGWYQADPVGLAPTPPQTYAQRMVELIGYDKLMANANAALTKGEFQYAAELASIAVTANPKNQAARELKAAAYMKLAEPQTNPNWRSWYLTSANELRNIFPREDTPAFSGGLTAPGIVEAMPYVDWVSQWSLRLKAEETIPANTHRSLGMYFGPAASNQTSQGFVLRVRRGVAEMISTGSDRGAIAAASPLYIEMDKDAQTLLVHADVAGKNYNFPQTLTELMAAGRIKVTGGTSADVSSFFQLFDRPPATQPVLSAR